MPNKKKITLPVVAEVPVKLTNALPLPPDTTEQEDIMRASQREISRIWEVTQSRIAMAVVLFTMINGSYLVFIGKSDQAIPTIFSVAFGMITGFYFARTNHEKIGGIGKKSNDNPDYQGR